MENVLNLEIHKNLENITNEDWPLLKELESTRFALKNKKGNKNNRDRKSLSAIKESTDIEDNIISKQNMQDEVLVEEFLENVNSKEIITIEVIEASKKQRESLEPNQLDLPLEKLEESYPSKIMEESQINTKVVTKDKEAVKISITKDVQQEEEVTFGNKEVSKLIAIGLAKIYINKTDSILNPLRFILNNLQQIGVALIQFAIPGFITWYLLENVQAISNQMSKESTFTYIIYVGVFYFACMFLWISGQVLSGGIWNMIKYAMKNLEKAGKN